MQRVPKKILPPRPQAKPTPSIPAVRNSGSIDVSFTSREFTTPKRESRIEEEREWCLKRNELKKNIDFSVKDLRPDELNPKYLHQKGKELFAKRNYLGAVSAFSAAVKITDNSADSLLLRAITQYKLKNYDHCVRFSCILLTISQIKILQNFVFPFQINDASLAYGNFKPITESNAIDRAKCLILKSKILNHFDYKKHAIEELKAAQKLYPTIDEWKLNLD